jgi:alkylation response protein AidB-like acyl-CoA dehydrogenase
MLADMATRVDASRLLVWRAAAMVDRKEGSFAKESAMAKMFASDTAMAVTTDAVQILGGYGYSREYPVEKYMRDAKIMQIYEGTNQIQRLVIAGKSIKVGGKNDISISASGKRKQAGHSNGKPPAGVKRPGL